jgi:hypothetical protein
MSAKTGERFAGVWPGTNRPVSAPAGLPFFLVLRTANSYNRSEIILPGMKIVVDDENQI